MYAYVDQCLEKGETQRARIYAQDAIRHKNEAMSMLRMQSRMDAVASRIESSIMMSQMTPQMSKVVKRMGGVLKVMKPEKVGKTMDQFNDLCEGLDIRVAGMESGIASATATTMGEDAIDQLMDETAAEIGTKIDAQIADAGDIAGLKDPKVKKAVAQNAERRAEQELEERLRKLRADPMAAS